MADQGTFIVLEGADGSGKATQFHLLKERLRAVGYEVEEFDFPRYDKDSSYFIRRYLNGDYGPATSVSPYTASLFYALDRYEAGSQIKLALDAGKVVISNRFVGANMAHQGSKLEDPIEQRSFFVWEDSLEYQLLGIPRPNINVFLNVPADVSKTLIESRSAKTGAKLDEHEKDTNYLAKTVRTYELLCEIFPQDFLSIDCAKDGEILSVAEINNRIWDAIKQYLPARPTGTAHSVTFKLSETQRPPAKRAEDREKSPAHNTKYRPGKLSLELILEIERLLPDAVKYRPSWEKSGYDYITPTGLPDKTRQKYEKSMESLGDLHKSMRDHLKKQADKDHLLAPALPLGALLETELNLSAEDIQKLSLRFSNDNRPEAVSLVNELVKQGLGGKAAAAAGQRPIRRESEPAPIEKIISKLVNEHLPSTLDAHTEKITLLESTPRNEFKILADALYPFSSLSREQLQDEIDGWSYQQKLDALVAAISTNTSGIAEQVRYRFDVIGDRLLLEKISKHQLAKILEIQPATPRYGYEVPAEVEAQEIEEQYIQCFDKSLELFSTLQAAGKESQAGFATLLGHKTRFQIELSLKQLQQAAGGLKDPELTLLVTELAAKIAEFHPIIGDSLIASGKAGPKPQAPERTSSRRKHRRSNRKNTK